MKSVKRLFPAKAALCLLMAGMLAACSSAEKWFGEEKDAPLPGKRISVLELQKKLTPDDPVAGAEGFVAPSPWRNEFWPQAGGYPNHSMQHLELGEGPLTLAWKAGIGRGSTKTLPLTAQPIIVDGKIFAMNTESELYALDAGTGQKLWHVKVRPAYEDEVVIGGGVAYSGGKLFASTGYDYLVALTPEDGQMIWSTRLPAPSRAAPTIMDNRVFVTLLDSRMVALDAEDGHILWDFSGVGEMSGLIGAASPAAGADVVIPAFSSGEVAALRVENGTLAWGDNLAAFRHAGGLASIADIRGLPVLDKGMVIAISHGDNMVAIDQRTGNRVWQKEIGSEETPWVAGNSIFVISTTGQLVALSRDSGEIRWVTEMPRWKNTETRKGEIFWTGPVLAGNRLILASSEGDVSEMNPETGTLLRTWSAGRSISLPLVVANGMLYMLADDGTLMAFK